MHSFKTHFKIRYIYLHKTKLISKNVLVKVKSKSLNLVVVTFSKSISWPQHLQKALVATKSLH